MQVMNFQFKLRSVKQILATLGYENRESSDWFNYSSNQPNRPANYWALSILCPVPSHLTSSHPVVSCESRDNHALRAGGASSPSPSRAAQHSFPMILFILLSRLRWLFPFSVVPSTLLMAVPVFRAAKTRQYMNESNSVEHWEEAPTTRVASFCWDPQNTVAWLCSCNAFLLPRIWHLAYHLG